MYSVRNRFNYHAANKHFKGGRGGGDRGARSSTAKLSVSNLDFGVSDEDMRV